MQARKNVAENVPRFSFILHKLREAMAEK